MHRSSESTAAIATALAKARTELTNPEKAMVRTVYNNRSDSPQSFRYASLSSGLDIVRKVLGGYQIAIAQTTERPHGISYALVFRPANGEPFVRFDNAHAPNRPGGKYVKTPAAYDHWHRDEHDVGRPYKFTRFAAPQ